MNEVARRPGAQVLIRELSWESTLSLAVLASLDKLMSAAFDNSRGIRRPTTNAPIFTADTHPRYTAPTALPVRSYHRTAALGRHCAHTHAEGVPAFTSCASQPRLLSAGLP